jgi:hypothetical protein
LDAAGFSHSQVALHVPASAQLALPPAPLDEPLEPLVLADPLVLVPLPLEVEWVPVEPPVPAEPDDDDVEGWPVEELLAPVPAVELEPQATAATDAVKRVQKRMLR